MRSPNLRWKPDPYLILLFGLSLFALTPLLAPGYFFSAHDGRHSVFFVSMFDEAIRDGVLWPVWAMHHNQGYGYPTFLIQAPLAFYLAEIFVLLGLGITQAVKAAWAVSFLLSAWGMYGLVRRWALTWPGGGKLSAAGAAQAGLLAALLFVYAPYHLVDIYVRAALAETVLIGWLPWVFWAFDRLIAGATGPGWQGRLALAALAYGGLILTHAFAIMAVTPLLVAFVLFRLWMQWRHDAPNLADGQARGMELVRRLAVAGAGGVAGLLLAAIFVLPLLTEGPLLAQEDWVQNTYLYSRHWVHWGQFFNPFWGYGYSDDPLGANDGMGFQIGLLLALLAIVALYLLRDRRWRAPSLAGFLLLVAAGLLYLMTPNADWLWRTVSLLSVLQFPWRLLGLVIFVLAALGGLTLLQMGGLGRSAQEGAGAALGLVAILIVLASAGYTQPASLEPVESWREDGRAVFQFEREHPDMLGYNTLATERFTETAMTPQYAAQFEQAGLARFDASPLARLGILAGEGTVTENYSRSHHFGGAVVMQTPGVVQIRLLAFPGWQVRVNDLCVDYRPSLPHGVMEVDLPAGVHRIDVVMGGTPARNTGAAISGLTLLGLLGLAGITRFARRRAPFTIPD